MPTQHDGKWSAPFQIENETGKAECCVDLTCASYPGMYGLICDREVDSDDHPMAMVKFEKWLKKLHHTKHGRGLEKWDFHYDEEPIKAFLKNAQEYLKDLLHTTT